MAIWILLTVAAQFINAVVAIVDKYIVSSSVLPRPVAYAFYLSILSALSIGIFLFGGVTVPFIGFEIPSVWNVSIPSTIIAFGSLGAGAALLGALVSLFFGLRDADATDVFPVAGAASAITAFVLAHYFLGTTLTQNFVLGFTLLVIGTLVLSLYRFGYITLWLSVVAGILFGVHFVILKYLFEITHFDNAFFWTRLGIAAVALSLLVVPFLRRQLAIHSRKTRRRAGALIVGNKVLAGIASLMLLKAIELGEVSVVQAMGGLQFAFLLTFAAVFGQRLPRPCGERCTARQLMHKTTAVAIIIAGFAMLFL